MDPKVQPSKTEEGRVKKARKPYSKPAIKLELELETRAGSPFSNPDPVDPGQAP